MEGASALRIARCQDPRYRVSAERHDHRAVHDALLLNTRVFPQPLDAVSWRFVATQTRSTHLEEARLVIACDAAPFADVAPSGSSCCPAQTSNMTVTS